MLALLAIFAYGYARSYTRNFLRMQQVVLLAGAWAAAGLPERRADHARAAR